MEPHTNAKPHEGADVMDQASGATDNRILIVDDDPQFRVELKEYLTDHGFRVGTAGDGEAMRARMEEAAYDLVIMDLTLPGEDGLALTQHIRRHSPIPVVMLTAREETVDRVIGLESGAADYITKPFEPRELVARIRSVLRRASSPTEMAAEKPGAVVKFEGRKLTRRSSRPAPIDRDRQHPKAKLSGGTSAPTRVIGPSGTPLTLEDLPPPDTRCWVIRRKAEVVAAVRGGLLSEEQACRRYGLSAQELNSWQRQIKAGVGRGQPNALPRHERRIGRLVLHLGRAEVDGQYLHLPPKEYAVLELLSSRQGETVTKEEVVSHLYGDAGAPSSKIIDVFICKLRTKLTAATGGENYLATMWGRGYMLRDPNERGSSVVAGTVDTAAADPAPAGEHKRAGWRGMTGLRFMRSLFRDVGGTVTIYIALVAPLLFGIGALTLDLGRLMTLNTELQSAADAAALAGARELDRFPGAIDKARAAAVNAVANTQTFATDGGGKQVVISGQDCAAAMPGEPCIRILKSLPASDSEPITATHVTTSDAEARFVEVRVGTRAVTNILIRLIGGPGSSATRATAVAGQDQVICEIPPMFMCNPLEPAGNTDLALPVNMATLDGRQVELFHQGDGGTLTPGNFGILCPTGTEGQTNCGGNRIKDMLASRTGTCVSLELAETKTGVTLSSVRTGINARLDYWTPQAKNGDNIPWRQIDAFTPAANVVQGATPPANTSGDGVQCEYTDLPASEALRMPRDQCLIDDNCGTVSGNVNGNSRIGDGNWDYREYFRINHGCDQSTNPTCKPVGWDALTNAAPWPPSRYETYRYELEQVPDSIVEPNQTIYDDAGNPVATTAEDGHAQCFQGAPPPIPGYNYFPAKQRDLTLLQDRRIMPIAIANCNALEANGMSTNGKFSFKIRQLGYVFLTEPIKNPSDSEIHAEILGTLDEGAMDSLIRDVVQLYRR